MLELFRYKSQIRVVKTVLVATGLFVLLCKASEWSSTTAKAEVVTSFSRWLLPRGFLRWFCLVLRCHLLHPVGTLLITPHTLKNQCKTTEPYEATHTSLQQKYSTTI